MFDTKPNILYLHSHDTGRYIQPYGYAVPTPNLQRLAEQGVLFRQAFCTSPTCSPSRASLVTGRYAHSCGMFGLAHGDWKLDDYSQHIVHTLREQAGYHSKLIGFQHIIDWDHPEVIGYDETECWGGGARGTQVVEPVRRFFQNPPDKPWFLSVGITDPHRGAGNRFFDDAHPQGDPRYVHPPAPLPDTPETRIDYADYLVLAEKFDKAVGAVLNALDACRLAENTLVICTTDHGLAFPRMKHSLYDDGLETFLIMRGPGGFHGGQVLDQLISQIDLFPTLCDYLDLTPPDWLQGVSFMPIIRRETDSVRDAIFGSHTSGGNTASTRCIRTARYKYIRHILGIPCPPGLAGHGPSAQLWKQHGWQDQPQSGEELYDLLFDPHEMNNLVARPDLQSTLSELRTRFNNWLAETNDPIAKGVQPKPPGK